MLMKPDKKKNVAALILGANTPKSKEDELKSANEELAEAPQMDPGLLSAAEEMMSAFEAKDVQGLAEALQSFLSMNEPAPLEPLD